jgi:uncharacterized protein
MSLDSPSLPPLVRAMMRPEFYPEHPAKVELVQTHVSYVFLAGEFVYKLKKAVHFSFLDCTEVTQRRHLCDEEIRLNRRLAPDVYVGRYPIFPAGDGFVLGVASNDRSDAVDYVIKMRRMPAEAMLDRMLARGAVNRATIRAIANVVVNFFGAASAHNATKHRSAAAVWRIIIGELTDCEQHVPATLTADQFRSIESFCRGFIASHWQMLNERANSGRVREGHGDLRCEHICIESGKISIFDCVEFSERLRTCDIGSEIAFLAMDLDRLGAPALADELVAAVMESTHDDDLPLLMPLYKCYRAIIRGVVESLRAREPEVEPRQREEAMALARGYFALASSYARNSAPVLVVICGFSGSGKSTIARAMQIRFGFPIVSSDLMRKKLLSIPPDHSAADDYRSGVYALEYIDKVYAAMLESAEHQLREGIGVILDATYQDPAHRKAALELAERLKVPILFVECRAQDAEIRRRLIDRKKANNPSDATVEVYERQLEDFVALKEIPAAQHLVIDTARAWFETVKDLGQALERARR